MSDNNKRVRGYRNRPLLKEDQRFVDCVVDKSLLDKYTTGSSEIILFKCPHCDETYLKKICRFNEYPNHKCNSTLICDNSEFVSAIHDKKELNKGYTVGSHVKLYFDCDICGEIYPCQIYHFSRGRRCGFCAGKKINKSNYAYNCEEMRLYAKYPEKLKYVALNSNKQMECICPDCGFEFKLRYADFSAGNRCPKHNNSKGEKCISRFLTEKNIEHKTQYKFKECKNINPLPFDFALLKKNTLVGLIEYHGGQHEQPVEYFGGVEQFKKTQINDKIKVDYCKDNNIPLLIIWYYENIEEKLNEFLNTLGINN